jgi:hypothetical protein
VQGLGVFAYDGRWDRLHRGASGALGPAAWSVRDSPIAFQAREKTARLALPGIQERRLVVHSRVVAPTGAAGSFVSFAKAPPRPTGVDRTIAALRLEGGARVEGSRLELRAPGDGLGFRVPEGARPRRLELRVVGRGDGTLGVGESDFGKETRWRDRPVSGSFRFRLPYHHPESVVESACRSGPAPVAIESVALVPPTEPEDVLRLP